MNGSNLCRFRRCSRDGDQMKTDLEPSLVQFEPIHVGEITTTTYESAALSVELRAPALPSSYTFTSKV